MEKIMQFFATNDVVADRFELWFNPDGHSEGFLTYGYAVPHNLPEGWRAYDIRHSDDDDAIPCTLEKSVIVNYYGTFLTKDNLDDLLEKGYADILDWNFID